MSVPRRVLARTAAAATLCALPFAAAAADDASFDVSAGYGDDVEVLALMVTFDRARPLLERPTWRLTAQYEFGATVFHGTRTDIGGYRTIAGFGATPVLRAEWPAERWPVFVEAGLGAMLITHTKLQLDHQFSTAFQFNEILGVGTRFGERSQYELGLRVQHMSNADIKGPNNGLTWGALRFAWKF